MHCSKWRNNALRRTPLAVGLALAIGAAGLPTHAVARESAALSVAATQPDFAAGAGRVAHVPARPATTYEVTSCADDGSAGTLRYVIDHAADGDMADLDNLTCSTITLSSGQIAIPQNNLTLSSTHPITIDAGGVSRVFEHDGSGTLYLKGIDATNGYFKYNSATSIAKGGCILSNGPIRLASSDVTGCGVVNTLGQVRGGGIYTQSGLTAYAYSSISNNTASGLDAFGGGLYSFATVYLKNSTVTGNSSLAITGASGTIISGGGIFTSGIARLISTTVSNNRAQADDGTAVGGGVVASAGAYLGFSSISGNSALSPSSNGGGIQAQRYSYIYYSTIDHNQSVNNAALAFIGIIGSARIGNSTISTNTATTGSSAVFSSVPTLINNCTIAFNVAAGNDAGLYFYTGATLDIESTIVANNTSTSGVSQDFVSRDAVTGAHNLIQNPGSAVPGDTITGVDPELEPLGSNFSLSGPLTHALSPTSPAIDRGSNLRNFNYDERGFFHERVFGITADIGAYEWDGVDNDTIFANGFD